MRLGAGRDPRVEERLRGVSGSCGNELVGRLTKRTVRTEGDRAEAYVEPLLVTQAASRPPQSVKRAQCALDACVRQPRSAARIHKVLRGR